MPHLTAQQHADRYYAAMDKHEQVALATPAGKAFSANNFTIDHTGGGCMAWSRLVDDTGWFIWITNASGTDVVLEDETDCWLIGLHGPDGQWHDCLDATDATQAIAIADRLHAARVAGDETSLPPLQNA